MPREMPTALVKMRTLAAADAVAHWRMEETSGTAVADAAGASNLTSSSSGNIVTGPFLGATANRGRTTTSASATGASTSGQRAALLAGNWTCEVWARPASIAGTGATMVSHGVAGGGPPEASNYLLLFRRNLGKLVTVWETTSGTNVVTTTAGSYLTAGQLHHLAARCRVVGATRTLDFFVDGRLVETFTGLSAAVGGGSGSWELGADVGGANRFAGDIYEVRIAGVALADEAIRDSYARGVRDWDMARAIASGDHVVVTRALIRDGGGVWRDLTDLYGVDFVQGWEESDGVDDDGASARLTLRRRHHWLSLQPGVATSRPNATDPGIYDQLVDVARRIKLEEAVLPAGASRDLAGDVHWQLAFDGYIRAVSHGGGEEIAVELIDRIRALQVAWVQPNRTPNPDVDFSYAASPTDIEDVLAQQLLDWAPAEGFGGGDGVTLYVPTSPAFVLDNAPGGFTVPATSSVLQAQTDLVDRTIGWLLRYRWDDARQEFRYTLYEPGRGNTWSASDPQLTSDDIVGWRRIETSDEDIRNDIEVEYGDAADGDNLSVNRRKAVRYTDTLSIARYWRRYARVSLASVSELSDAAQAGDLCNAILSDLAYPLADLEIDVRARRDIQIGDLVKLIADDEHFSADTVVAVVGVRHSRAGDRRTTLVLRGERPVGRRRRWMEIVDMVLVGDGLTPMPTPAAPSLTAIQNGVVVDWTYPANWGNRRYKETEIHMSASSGFTPDPSTLVEVVRGKSAATLRNLERSTRYLKLVHRDEMGNSSTASAQASTSPRWTGVAPHVHATRSGDQTLGTGGTNTVVWNAVTSGTNTGACYDSTTGKWSADVAGMVTISASIQYDSAAKAGTQAWLEIHVDGVLRVAGARATVSGSPLRCVVTVQATLWLPAGSYFTVEERDTGGNSGNAVVDDDSKTWLAAHLAVQAT